MSAIELQDDYTVTGDFNNDSVECESPSYKISSDPPSSQSDSVETCHSPKSQEGGESIFSFMMQRKTDKRSFRTRYNSFLKELGECSSTVVVTPTLRWKVVNYNSHSKVYTAKVIYHPLMCSQFRRVKPGVSPKHRSVYTPKSN